MNMQNKVFRGQEEDRFTGAIEAQTSKIPSSGYLARGNRFHGGISSLKGDGPQ